ncbi:substrate-binding domain-containing protein [Duganella sp. P38]|uniref:substrate-binding domain-containing protein n=1 Tax=Duganella sp. P38 TaxID=3423949 RepID=UPI003D7A4A4D
MKTKTRLAAIAVLLLAPIAAHAAGCIGFIPSGGGGSFWRAVHSGATEAGNALGYEIYFRGPQAEDQADIQNIVLEVVRQRRCLAVVIAPGSLEVAPAVAKLKQSGIPWIYVDRSLGAPAAAGMVGTDNYKAGQLAGESMAASLHGKGAVLLFRMKLGWQTTGERERGFADAARRGGLTVIDAGPIGAVYGEAFIRSSAALTRYAGRFQGVFAPNEATSMGVLTALREHGLVGPVTYIAVDVTDQLLEGVRTGAVAGLIAQAPHAIGYHAVHMAAAAIEKKLPARRTVMLDAVYITPSNLDSYMP